MSDTETPQDNPGHGSPADPEQPVGETGQPAPQSSAQPAGPPQNVDPTEPEAPAPPPPPQYVEPQAPPPPPQYVEPQAPAAAPPLQHVEAPQAPPLQPPPAAAPTYPPPAAPEYVAPPPPPNPPAQSFAPQDPSAQISPAVAPQIPAEHSFAPHAPAPQAPGNGSGSAGGPPPTARAGRSGIRLPKPQLHVSRTLLWAIVAALCAAGGAVASVLGAHSVAHSDTTSARKTSQQSAVAVATSAKQAIQREQELNVSGATYFAGNPTSSQSQFSTWAKWAQMLHRYPELQQLGLVTLVRAPELPKFEAQAKGTPLVRTTVTAAATRPTATKTAKPATPQAATRPTPRLHIRPAGARPYYCLALARLARSPGERPPAGFDYCASRNGLLVSRDTGLSHYTAMSASGAEVLEVMTPVYRGNQPPATQAARQAAFTGWLRELLSPVIVVRQALQGHQGALTMIFHSHTANVEFAGHTADPGGPATTVTASGGWTIQAYGATVGTGVLSDGNALALLIVGCALSALLGLLVFVLGTGGGRAPQPARTQGPQLAGGPNEDLHDPLTGLPNRALMIDRAECMLARAGRQSGLLVGALFIDIDWFEDLNTRIGREGSDQVLKIVAERLEGVVRAGDTVGRLGSDEFVLLVESAARGARLDSLARRVVEALHKPFEIDGAGPDLFITASIGVAFGRYETPEDLLRDAQLALHAAKAAGKDRYTLFNANMRSVIEGRGVLEVELNAALAEKQFFLLYEPIFDLGSGTVAGLEALVRWLHPKQGVLLPVDFIPLAEETGLTVPIGRWVLEEACNRAAAWNVAGHHIGITVEVSANQLNRDGFVTDVRRALQQSGIEPGLLTLAIAETTVMRDVAAAVNRLEEIKQLGVRLAIDDFGGSGYAYHSDLRRLPLDFLKVDRSSLAASEDEDYRTWLLEAIMIVGRDLSLTVIAKGIESLEQMGALQTMGCMMAQGDMMGKPVPASAIESVFSMTLPTVRTNAQ